MGLVLARKTRSYRGYQLDFRVSYPAVWSPSPGLVCWVESLYGSSKEWDTIPDRIEETRLRYNGSSKSADHPREIRRCDQNHNQVP